jgi:polyphenol oxidase
LRLTRTSIPAELKGGFAAAFPGSASTGPEPIALMSFVEAGDMKFGDLGSTPNRERFLLDAGFPLSRVRGLELAHSKNVLFPSRGDEPSGPADGLVLSQPELAASVTVADCMPIWVLDRESGAFGILHSGWRGTGILEVAVRGIEGHYRSRPSSIAVILGPAIGPCCYSVSEERAARFSAEFGENSVSRRGGSFYLDLRTANVSIAKRVGIGQLLSIEACTSCDERLGSYRRQGSASFTRMLAVCGRGSRGSDISVPVHLHKN